MILRYTGLSIQCWGRFDLLSENLFVAYVNGEAPAPGVVGEAC